MPPRRTLTIRRESFPIRGTFRISRGSKTEAVVVTAEIGQDGQIGRGECVPYQRYGETVENIIRTLEDLAGPVAAGLDRAALQDALPAGAARNALDCALWDLEAKLAGRPAWQLAGLAAPRPLTTCFTLSIDAPERMGAAAAAAAAMPILKLKLAGDGQDPPRVAAVREAAPAARIVLDANEAWDLPALAAQASIYRDLGVELIEQPLAAADDGVLLGFRSPVPLAADESCQGTDWLDRIVGRYQMVNLKLDKTGGLTAALALRRQAEAAGLGIMVGCMVATSLAMAPAVLLAQGAAYVDLDGPLLLAKDREPGLRFRDATLFPPEPALWG